MALISKAQGEHWSIVTMYNVISEGWSVGRNPNTKASRSGAGKGTWEPLEITLYDQIVPSGAQAVMEWVRLHHESVTGRDGYSDFYKKEIKFNLLGPVGDKVEEWELKGAFIQTANFNDLDFANGTDVADISLTLRYDYAVLSF